MSVVGVDPSFEHPAERHVVIYTDGSCIGNPGPGGWAAVLHSYEGERLLKRKPFSNGAAHTTNIYMEMTAAIKGLEKLKRRSVPVFVFSDSEHVIKGMTERLAGWKTKGWKNSQGKPVKHRHLWERLEELTSERLVEWHKVRGHSGDPMNEEADRLANEAAEMRRANRRTRPGT